MTHWAKGIIEWIDEARDTAFVSVPFTWLLPEAWSRCAALRQENYRVLAGGPAVTLSMIYEHLPDMREVAELGYHVDALSHHNPDATFTSRGCIRRCPFCAVPKIEGDLRELDHWEPRPIVCDNNLLACSRTHFDKVIDSLKPLTEIDFNQGLDARLLTDYHVSRLCELDLKYVRFAWDNMASEDAVHDAIFRCIAAGIPRDKIRVYVLVGYDDTPDDARCRCETLKSVGIFPFVQRYQPLDAMTKDSWVGENWTAEELPRFLRYWNRQSWLRSIEYENYDRRTRKPTSPQQTSLGCRQIV